MEKAKQSGQIPAISRAVAVLDFVGLKPGCSFTTIHSELGLPKSSAYMLIKTLVSLGLLRISSGGGYTLGLRLFELGALSVRHLDVRKEALPLMRKLTNEVQLTSHLGILEGAEGVYLAKVECNQAIIVNSWEGKRVSLNTSALGKSLLLSAGPELFNELVRTLPLHQATKSSIITREAFIEHIEEARRKGWTIDDEEADAGTRCVGTPVYGIQGPPLSLSVAGPSNQVPYRRMEELAHSLMEVSRQLSHSLGVRLPTR